LPILVCGSSMPRIFIASTDVLRRPVQNWPASSRPDSAFGIFGLRTVTSGSTAVACSGTARTLARTAPASIRLPHDPDLLRRDLLNLKAMGFNGVRFISTLPQRYQLELCDELGLMVYEESYASWQLQDSPSLGERMDRSLTGMVFARQNHPSVVMWGLLNETGLGNVFSHAVASLPLMRRLDDSRIVILGSGRFDAIGNFLNGLEIWKPETGFAPCLTHNPKSYGICGVALWRPKEVAMIPGVNGEYGAARWTVRPMATIPCRRNFEDPALSRQVTCMFFWAGNQCTAVSLTSRDTATSARI